MLLGMLPTFRTNLLSTSLTVILYLKHGRCALVQPWLWVDRNGERFYNESRGSLFTDVYASNDSSRRFDVHDLGPEKI